MRQRMSVVGLMVVAMCAVPAGAATFTVATANGQGEPEPEPNSEVQEGFNPTITCSSENGTIHDLLLCLLDEIVTLPTPCYDIELQGDLTETIGEDTGNSVLQEIQFEGPSGDCPVDPLDRDDFIVRFFPRMPPYGLEILTIEEQEIEKITLKENDPNIQWTELRLEKSHRRIRIGDLVENPSGRGAIHLTLNGRELQIPTAGYRTSVELSAAIVRKLRTSGYDVKYEAPYTWVTYDRLHDEYIGRVVFRSTDAAVVTSDIGILPPDPAVPELEIFPIEVPGPGPGPALVPAGSH